MTRVQLIEASPFAAVFPDGVPVKSPVAQFANCGGSIERCYFADLEAMRDDEKLGIWRVLSKASGLDAEAVAREIARDGLPIRETQVQSAPGIPMRFLS